MFRQTFRRFMEAEVERNVDRWLEAHEIEREFWLKAGAAGVLGADIPTGYGGPGGRHARGCRVRRQPAWLSS